MAYTPEGNRKITEKVIAEKGVDADGKSLHHKRAGALGGAKTPGHFRKLAETPEGREKLKEISRRGAAESNKKQGKGEANRDN